MASPPNPTVVTVVPYEYLFCLLSSERSQSPTRWKAQGLLLGSYTPGSVGRRLRLNESGYDPVPSNEKQLGNQVPHTEYGPTAPD
jgi:hypothetical protein